jgi:2'-5' RNA ligase
MKKAHIRVLAGDRVTVEMTPYDLSKGRITSGRERRACPHRLRAEGRSSADAKALGTAVPRLFVGIDFPTEIKLTLAEPCAGVPGAKWVAPSNFHLTLRFIGGVEDATAANVSAALLLVKAPRFALTLAGVGHFAGHTLWVGVEKNSTLVCLQGKIENELQQIGLPAADHRPFVPHVQGGVFALATESSCVPDQERGIPYQPIRGQLFQLDRKPSEFERVPLMSTRRIMF